MYTQVESFTISAEDVSARLPWIKEQVRLEVAAQNLTDSSKIEDKQHEMELRELASLGIKEGQTVHLRLFTDPPLETADLWTSIDSPLVSVGGIDLVDVIYAVAVTPVNHQQPTTKGFIKNNTYWLGVQPIMDIKPENLRELKTNIANSHIVGILDQNIDVLTTRLKDSLITAKQALESQEAGSVTFLTLRIEPYHPSGKRNKGLKVAGHFECFQLTHDLERRGQFILHEANSTLIHDGTVRVDQINTLENHDALTYVLQQAQDAGYNISTIKRKTVYRQYKSEGCGFCALQTAIDASRLASSITDLPFKECSQTSAQYPDLTLEGELRLTQAAALFSSSNPDVQFELMLAKANQYITLADDDDLQYPPSPEMLRKYLTLHQQNSGLTDMSVSPAGNLRQSSATAEVTSVKAAPSSVISVSQEILQPTLREAMDGILEPLYQSIEEYCSGLSLKPEVYSWLPMFMRGYSNSVKIAATSNLIDFLSIQNLKIDDECVNILDNGDIKVILQAFITANKSSLQRNNISTESPKAFLMSLNKRNVSEDISTADVSCVGGGGARR